MEDWIDLGTAVKVRLSYPKAFFQKFVSASVTVLCQNACPAIWISYNLLSFLVVYQ